MNISSYIFTILFILIIDIIWLLSNSKNYNKLIKNVQGSILNLNFIGAILSYLTLIFALFFFSIPIINSKLKENKNSLLYLCIIYGGGLGFLMYGMFNTTNLAIFKNYDIYVGLLDTFWGFIVFSLGSYFYFSIKKN